MHRGDLAEEVDVTVDHPGHDRRAASVDYVRPARRLDATTDALNDVAVENQSAVRHRVAAGAVEDGGVNDGGGHGAGSFFDLSSGEKRRCRPRHFRKGRWPIVPGIVQTPD